RGRPLAVGADLRGGVQGDLRLRLRDRSGAGPPAGAFRASAGGDRARAALPDAGRRPLRLPEPHEPPERQVGYGGDAVGGVPAAGAADRGMAAGGGGGRPDLGKRLRIGIGVASRYSLQRAGRPAWIDVTVSPFRRFVHMTRRLHTVMRRLRPLLLGLVLMLPTALPAPALAQVNRDEAVKEADGRLRGYTQNGVVLNESSTALTYFAFIGLALLSMGVMFKLARRTHLD